MNLPQLCRDAAKILEQNEWTRFANARDEHGELVLSDSPEARQFCMFGAFCRAMHESGVKGQAVWAAQLYRRCRKATKTNHVDAVPYFNDNVCRDKQHAIDTLLLMAEGETK